MSGDRPDVPLVGDPPVGGRTNGPNPGHVTHRILTGAAFIARHVPPVWLIDGIVQRSRLYACTSLTGHGKTAVWLFNACMIHAGRMIGNLETFQGNVLILAGENPSDLEARMIGMAKTYNIPHGQLPYVLPGSFPMDDEGAEALKRDITGLGVPLAAIIGDTASSFFPGDDENSNVQAGGYARTLRTFTKCEGEPAIVVLSHPTKGATRDSLLPRGGGAFLNELDGNFDLWSQTQGEVTEMHWVGKIRGPNFSPFGYRLRMVPTGLIDEKRRPEMTIIAEPMSEEAIADHSKQALANEDAVLMALRDNPSWSFTQIAIGAGWVDSGGKPEKGKVQRAIKSLADDKLVTQVRRRAPWTITKTGKEAIAAKGGNGAAKPWTDEDVDITPKAAPEPVPPTDAEVSAEIDRHNALPVTQRDADLRPTAKRLRMRVGTFERLARAKAQADTGGQPTEEAAPEPPPPPAPTRAEIDAAIAAYLKLDEAERALQEAATAASLDKNLGVFRALVKAALRNAPKPPPPAKKKAEAAKKTAKPRAKKAPK